MIKIFPFLIAAIIILILIIIVLSMILNKIKKEEKTLRKINDNYKLAASKVEENIRNANEQKKKLNTGDDSIDVNNATDIMRDISRRRSKS